MTDQSLDSGAATESSHDAVATEIAASEAPQSSSVLSNAPAPPTQDQSADPTINGGSGPMEASIAGLSTGQDPKSEDSRPTSIQAVPDTAGTVQPPGYAAAREQLLKSMTTSESFNPATPPPTQGAIQRATVKRGGRGGRGGAPRRGGGEPGDGTAPSTHTPGRGRGRGRPGRPRGRGRGRGGASVRGTKRKRGDGEDGEGSEESSSDEEFTAVAMTKSGRTVQKPTAFVPPPPSAPTTVAAAAGAGPAGSPSGATPLKKRRGYRRNPDAAVCRVCLRGTSPASNMIVFCDGCNTAYHRFCHQPAIDQSVIDEVEKEWYCKQCEQERMVPVSDAEVSDFVSAPEASLEQRQRYFGSLAPGMLVTLLIRATTLSPDLPLFPPGFISRPASSPDADGQGDSRPPDNGLTIAPHPPALKPATTNGLVPKSSKVAEDEKVPDDHPPTYPRPGDGLMQKLPSEREDSRWLVDDGERFGVFTHLYQVDAHAASTSLNGHADGVATGAAQ